jgi:S-formylglutathione hydrolase
LLEELRLACVCPHGDESWWTDRACPSFDPVLTAEKYLLDHVVPFFRERFGLTPRAIGVYGIGMGGQGALRLAFRHPKIFPVAAGVAPALDYHEIYGQGTPLDEMYDSKEQCRQDTALMHVPPYDPPPHIFFACDPDDIEWYRGSDRLHEKLGALGVEHTADLTTQAGGHSDAYFDHMAAPALRFIVDGLEKESRRLL